MSKPAESGGPRASVLSRSDLESAVSVLRDARHARRGADRPTRIRTSPHIRQEFAELLTKAGFDAGEFEAIRARNLIELRHHAEKQQVEAVKNSSAIRDILHRDALSRLDSLNQPLAPPEPFVELLDRPDIIQFDTTENASMESVHYEPLNSFAKLKINEDSDTFAHENIDFYFTWQNARTTSVKIAVLGVPGVHGHTTAGTNGGFITVHDVAFIDLTFTMTVLQQWLHPPTLAPLDPSASERLIVADIVKDWSFGDPGEVDVRPVFRGFPLEYEALTVPSNGVLVFDVNLSIGYETLNGGVTIDFASGAYEVQCPFIHITGTDAGP